MNKYGLSHHKQLTLLGKYLNEKIDAWPEKFKPFENWVDKYMEGAKLKGKKAIIQDRKERCRYCARYFNDEVFKTKDHVVPTSRGGLNVKENRVFCCSDCNGWKADSSLESFLKDVKRVLKKDNIRLPYNKALLSNMVRNINNQINETKQNKSKVSTYKI